MCIANSVCLLFPLLTYSLQSCLYIQIARSNSNKSGDSKKSTNDSSSSSPDITSRGPLGGGNNNNNNNSQCQPNHQNNHINNNLNNNGNGPLTATMSETSDDSSLNSVELDPMGKRNATLLLLCVRSV